METGDPYINIILYPPITLTSFSYESNVKDYYLLTLRLAIYKIIYLFIFFVMLKLVPFWHRFIRYSIQSVRVIPVHKVIIYLPFEITS